MARNCTRTSKSMTAICAEPSSPPPAEYLNGFLVTGICTAHILVIESLPDYGESSLSDSEKKELDDAIGLLADNKDAIYGVVMLALFFDDKNKTDHRNQAKALVCIAKYLSTHPVKEGSDAEIVRMVREISAENNLHSMLDD